MTSACPASPPEIQPEVRTEAPKARPRRKTARPRTAAWSLPAGAFVGVSLLLVAYLFQYAQIVGLQYRLIAKKETLRTLLHEKEELELKVQELTALERIEKEALARGLDYPESRQNLELVRFACERLSCSLFMAFAASAIF